MERSYLFMGIFLYTFFSQGNCQSQLPLVYVNDGVTDRACFTFDKDGMGVTEIPSGLIRRGDNQPIAGYSFTGTFTSTLVFSKRITKQNVTTLVANNGSPYIVSVSFCLNGVTAEDAVMYYVTDAAGQHHNIQLYLVGQGQSQLPPVYVYDDVSERACFTFNKDDMGVTEIPSGIVRKGNAIAFIRYDFDGNFMSFPGFADRITQINVTTVVGSNGSPIIVSVSFCLNGVTDEDAVTYYVTDAAGQHHNIQVYLVGNCQSQLPPVYVYDDIKNRACFTFTKNKMGVPEIPSGSIRRGTNGVAVARYSAVGTFSLFPDFDGRITGNVTTVVNSVGNTIIVSVSFCLNGVTAEDAVTYYVTDAAGQNYNIQLYLVGTSQSHLPPVYVYDYVTDRACFTFDKNEMRVTQIPPGVIRRGSTGEGLILFENDGSFTIAATFQTRITQEHVTTGVDSVGNTLIVSVSFCLNGVTAEDAVTYYVTDAAGQHHNIQLYLVGNCQSQLPPVYVYDDVTNRACFTFNKDEMGLTEIPSGSIRRGVNGVAVARYSAVGTFSSFPDFDGRITGNVTTVVDSNGSTYVVSVSFCLNGVTAEDAVTYYVTDAAGQHHNKQLYLVGQSQSQLSPVYVYDDVTDRACFTFNKDVIGVEQFPPGFIRRGDTQPVAYISAAGSFTPSTGFADRITQKNVTTVVNSFGNTIIVSVSFCLTGVTADDAVTYYVFDAAGQHHKIQLYLVGIPSDTTVQGPTSAVQGSTISLICAASSNSTPAAPPTGLSMYYTWMVNSQPVGSRDRYTVGGTYGDTLTVRDVQKSDRITEIRCSARENNISRESTSSPVFINVIYPPEAVISPEYSPYIIERGSDITLRCSITDGNPSVTSYEWVPSNLGHSSVVTVLNVTNDTQYSCRGQNGVGSGQWTHRSVMILYGPVIKKFLVQNPHEGSSPSYHCNVDSKPKATVYWVSEKSGQRVDGNSLTIYNISRNDSGNYTCFANNTLDLSGTEPKTKTAQLVVEVDVFYGPQGSVTILPGRAIDVIEGHDVLLHCSSSCKPECSISWNGPALNHFSGFILPLRNITLKQHGNYICTASNPLNMANKSVVLNILYSSKFLNITGKKEVNEGDEIDLTCHGDGNPVPAYTWIHMNNGTVIQKSSVLKITHANCIDTGYFQCEAANSVGIKTKETQMYVRCSPRLDYRFNSPHSQIAIKNDEQLNLSLQIIAYPSPLKNNVHWMHKQYITDKGKEVEGELELKSYTFWHEIFLLKNDMMENDFGYYFLVVDTISIDLLYHVVSISKPFQPNLTHIECLNEGEVKLQWIEQFNGGFLQRFSFKYYRASGSFLTYASNILEQGSGSTHSKNILLDVKESSVYSFQVITTNVIGTTESNILNCTVQGKTDKPGTIQPIIGGAVGGTLLLTLIVVFVVIFLRKQKSIKCFGIDKEESKTKNRTNDESNIYERYNGNPSNADMYAELKDYNHQNKNKQTEKIIYENLKLNI